MPVFQLPGLQGLTVGIDSAIGTRARRTNAATSEFLDLLNARRAGILDNDDLEFRRNFAEQPSNTSLLERYDNILSSTTNPFVGTQAAIAQAGAAPLLAQRAIQNPAFGLANGLPTQVNPSVQQAYFGVQPILDQQADANRQRIFAQAPSVASGGFQQTAQGTLVQNSQNQRDAGTLALLEAFEKQIAALNEENSRLRTSNVPLPVARTNTGTAGDLLSSASAR